MKRKQFLHVLCRGSGMALMSPRLYTTGAMAARTVATATVNHAVNGSPRDNLAKIISMSGGIEHLVGADDIVVIKPNLQWWNQGAPNLAALDTLVELIMNRAGFAGEVIVAENCHRGNDPALSPRAGWAHQFDINSDIPGITSMNALAADLKRRFGDRFSTRHWIDSWAPGQQRVSSPGEGTGYILCDGSGGTDLICLGNGISGDGYRETIMSYPVFTTDTGTIIDFRFGEWKNGAYTGRPLRLFNMAALNHHSSYCGYTAAIKNHLGIVDLSGGAGGDIGGMLSDEYRNFHSFPFDGNSPGPAPGMLGAEVGEFLRTVRAADLHIITAEWIGTESRTEPPVFHMRSVLASRDPVALDAYAGLNLLYPMSQNEDHNPLNQSSPPYQYLAACAGHGGGVFDIPNTTVEIFDFNDPPVRVHTDIPAGITLHQNHPNPFNATTTITFSIDKPSRVRLVVYSSAGLPVRVLIDGLCRAGSHTVIWDGIINGAQMASSGVYVYQLQTPYGVTGKRMTLLR